jgi:hypothetical protein
MATQFKALATAIPGLVVHLFDEEHGQIVEVPVVAMAMDMKGELHPVILARKLDDEDLVVGSRFVCADKFKDYCRTLINAGGEDYDAEAEETHSRLIAANIGLVEEDEDPEAEDEDEDDEDEDEESGAGAVRMASGNT